MREKKAYHGFRVEKVEIGNENIITASVGARCSYVIDYIYAPYGSEGRETCDTALNQGNTTIMTGYYYFGESS